MNIELKIAEISEIDDILKLHSKYQIDSIKQEDKADGFVTTAFTKEPMFAFMMAGLSDFEYEGQILTVENSYQYGPVCIDKSVRGSGVLEQIFAFAKQHMAQRFQFLVTFVNTMNERSYQAHKRKLGLHVVQQFDYNGKRYYEMVCNTANSECC